MPRVTSQSLRKSGLWRPHGSIECYVDGNILSRNPFVNQVFGVRAERGKDMKTMEEKVAIPS